MMCAMNRHLGSVVLALSIVLVPSAAGSESSEVSRISDDRIKESSGLAISAQHRDLAYTINDAGNAPIVYAIEISTGDVVGETKVGGGPVRDSEAIAIDGKGRMWLADLGDNDEERDDVALYRFPEPGPGNHSVDATRFPVSYGSGPVDVEAFLVHPETNEKFLITKEKKNGGALLALPGKLAADRANPARDVGKQMPQDTSDGTFTPDGSQALVRTRESVFVYDPKTWQQVEQLSVPEVEQGESIAMEPDGRSFIIGSEGKNSPLIRVAFGPQDEATDAPTDEPTPAPTAEPEAAEETGTALPAWVVIVGGLAAVGVLAGVAWWVARRG